MWFMSFINTCAYWNKWVSRKYDGLIFHGHVTSAFVYNWRLHPPDVTGAGQSYVLFT